MASNGTYWWYMGSVFESAVPRMSQKLYRPYTTGIAAGNLRGWEKDTKQYRIGYGESWLIRYYVHETL